MVAHAANDLRRGVVSHDGDLTLVCLLLCLSGYSAGRGPINDRSTSAGTNKVDPRGIETTLAHLRRHVTAGLNVDTSGFGVVGDTRTDRRDCLRPLRTGSDHGTARSAWHLATQSNIESQGIRDRACYSGDPVCIADCDREGSGDNRSHATTQQRLVSETVWFQLLDVGRFDF